MACVNGQHKQTQRVVSSHVDIVYIRIYIYITIHRVESCQHCVCTHSYMYTYIESCRVKSTLCICTSTCITYVQSCPGMSTLCVYASTYIYICRVVSRHMDMCIYASTQIYIYSVESCRHCVYTHPQIYTYLESCQVMWTLCIYASTQIYI